MSTRTTSQAKGTQLAKRPVQKTRTAASFSTGQNHWEVIAEAKQLPSHGRRVPKQMPNAQNSSLCFQGQDIGGRVHAGRMNRVPTVLRQKLMIDLVVVGGPPTDNAFDFWFGVWLLRRGGLVI